MSSEDPNLISLARAIRARQCLLFAGAGLSAQASTASGRSLPTWAELLRGMIVWCRDSDVDFADADDLETAIRQGRLLPVAQELQERIGNNLGPCLREILSTSGMEVSEAHSLTVQMGTRGMLTSNYDGLLEQAYDKARLPSPLYRVGPRQPALAIDYLREERPFIFKVHGDIITDPETIVLGHWDYSHMTNERPDYQAVMQDLFMGNTVFFVGFGATDPDLMSILDRVSSVLRKSPHKHYLLVSDKAFLPFERKRLQKDFHLVCLTYAYDEKHSRLAEVLRRLLALSKTADMPTRHHMGPVPRFTAQMAHAKEMWLCAKTGRELLKDHAFFERTWAGRRVRLILGSPGGPGLQAYKLQFDREMDQEVKAVTEFFRTLNDLRAHAGQPAIDVEVRHHPHPSSVVSIADPKEPRTATSSAVVADQPFGAQSNERPLLLHTWADQPEAFQRDLIHFLEDWGDANVVVQSSASTPVCEANAALELDQGRLSLACDAAGSRAVIDAGWLRGMFGVLAANGAVVASESSLGGWGERAAYGGDDLLTRSQLEVAPLWSVIGPGVSGGMCTRLSLRDLRPALPFRTGKTSDLMWHAEVVALIDGSDFRYGQPLFIRDFGPILTGELPAFRLRLRCGDPAPTEFCGRRCELCGADDAEVLHIVGISRVVRCRGCGLEYDNPQAVVPVAAFDKYASINEGRNSRAPAVARAVTNADVIMNLLRERDPGLLQGRLLDVGCASGELLHVLASRHGWPTRRLMGIDPSSLCTDIARRDYELPIDQTTVEDAVFASGSFDVVLVVNTFEHLPAPRRALESLRSWLRPGGLLILGNVPNAGGLMARLEPCRFIDKNFSDGEHHFHYTPDTLRALCEYEGFQVTRSEGRLQDIVGDRQRETAAWIAYSCGVDLDVCRDESAMLQALRERVARVMDRDLVDSPLAVLADALPPCGSPAGGAGALVDFWRNSVWSEPRFSEAFWLCLSPAPAGPTDHAPLGSR